MVNLYDLVNIKWLIFIIRNDILLINVGNVIYIYIYLNSIAKDFKAWIQYKTKIIELMEDGRMYNIKNLC
jgi:hypothetical protein